MLCQSPAPDMSLAQWSEYRELHELGQSGSVRVRESCAKFRNSVVEPPNSWTLRDENLSEFHVKAAPVRDAGLAGVRLLRPRCGPAARGRRPKRGERRRSWGRRQWLCGTV